MQDFDVLVIVLTCNMSEKVPGASHTYARLFKDHSRTAFAI